MSDKMPSEHYALKFLEGGVPKVINGKRYLEMNGELVNVATSLSEATFVRDWLLGFSLGYVGEKSYFDFARWMEISNEGRSAVIIHDNEDENKPVFVVPPLTDTKMTAQEMEVLQVAAGVMSNAYGAQFGGSTSRSTEILLQGLSIIQKGLRSGEYTITDLVPPAIYEKYSINPRVFKKMMHCKNTFGLDTNDESWKVLEACFRVIDEGKVLKQQQYDFLMAITQNTAIVPDQCKPDSKNKQEDQFTEINPFEC